ncbi:unnamed protein product [Amoebophrya sp. A120]|nr:unnamed protein product [Amoebophrya sp. A120]|eukprot:GSA120T00009186001.1
MPLQNSVRKEKIFIRRWYCKKCLDASYLSLNFLDPPPKPIKRYTMPTPGQEEDFKNQIPIVTGPNPVTGASPVHATSKKSDVPAHVVDPSPSLSAMSSLTATEKAKMQRLIDEHRGKPAFFCYGCETKPLFDGGPVPEMGLKFRPYDKPY